jgi:hypothetical protein
MAVQIFLLKNGDHFNTMSLDYKGDKVSRAFSTPKAVLALVQKAKDNSCIQNAIVEKRNNLYQCL